MNNLDSPAPPTPVAPKIGVTSLPEVTDEPSTNAPSSEGSDLSNLTTAQLYDLNQSLFDEATDVNRPLIDDIVPISALRAEYEKGNPLFVKQIDWLEENGYRYIRRTRGDGDCFYRSVAFAYVERIMSAHEPAKEAQQAISTLKATLPTLENVGFQRIVFEDFYEVLESLLVRVAALDPSKNKRLDPEALLEAFQSPEVSNSIVVYLRLLTSAQIRIDPDAFAGFLCHPELGEPMEVRDFCETFVEAVSKEADHVQMTALTRALSLNVDVAYLDGRNSNGQVDFVKLRNPEESKETPITLLYRPGHYDILLHAQ